MQRVIGKYKLHKPHDDTNPENNAIPSYYARFSEMAIQRDNGPIIAKFLDTPDHIMVTLCYYGGKGFPYLGLPLVNRTPSMTFYMPRNWTPEQERQYLDCILISYCATIHSLRRLQETC